VTDATAQTPPAPLWSPKPIPKPSQPSELHKRYIAGWQAKRKRQQASWRRAALWLTVLGALGIGAAIKINELAPRFAWAFEKLLWLLGFIPWTLNKFGMIASPDLPQWVSTVLAYTLPPALLLGLIQVVPAFLVWWERKVAAHAQGRLGPMSVGGWHGWAQTIADGIKLFLKEIIEPEGIDKWTYRLAPLIVFLPAYLSFAPLPFGKGLVAIDLDIGLLYVMSVSGISTIGILMAGWGSANKYSILGGLRAAAQVVSFEIPRLFSVVPMVMWAGTLSLTKIIDYQVGYWYGFIPSWFIFYPVVGQIAFVIYLLTTIAETNRVPFDMPEAESELTAGFHTEYGGMKFAIFFLAEYAYVFVGSVLGVIVFLGGGAAPLPALELIPSWAWFLAKTGVLIFFILLTRWTLPRLRVDRIMDLCWKIFLPWTFINIFIAAAWIVWRAN